MKRCPKCEKHLAESNFWKNRGTKDGLDYWCMYCQKEWKQIHKKETAITKAKYYQQHKKRFNILEYRYNRYKQGAKRRNHIFKLSLFDFTTLIVQPCYYCDRKDGIYNGIDRVNNTKGYVNNNCVSCCKKCNFMKGSLQ